MFLGKTPHRRVSNSEIYILLEPEDSDTLKIQQWEN